MRRAERCSVLCVQTCAPVIMMAEKGADMVLRQRAALKSYSLQLQQAQQQAAMNSPAAEAPAPAAAAAP